MTKVKGSPQIKRHDEIARPELREQPPITEATEVDEPAAPEDGMGGLERPDKARLGDDKPDTSGSMARGAEEPRGGKLPDVVGLRVKPGKGKPDPIDTGQTGVPKSGGGQEKRYGYEVGPTRPDTFAYEFDKNWGNKDGELGELEAAMHWAAYALNELYGSHIRYSMQESTIQQQLDGGSTYVRIDEAEFRRDFLDPLIEKGYPITMEAQMGILLEIATPSHLKKVYGREPKRDETLSLVAKTMARRHVPISDYCTYLTSRGRQGYKDMMHTMKAYMAECDRIGWHPGD